MINSTYLTARQQAGLEPVKEARTRPKREVVPEYILLVSMVALACLVNYLNWRADAQDHARMFAAQHTNNHAPKPPYIISTPMRKEVIYIDDVKVQRQWYFNDDASMRYVDTVPADSAKKIGYVKNDVVYSHDRRKKVWQRTEVAKGDSGSAAAYIAFDFKYDDERNYTMTVVSATPGGWDWTHHFDTYRNDQLAKQIIYDRFGASMQKDFTVDMTAKPPEVAATEPTRSASAEEQSAPRPTPPRRPNGPNVPPPRVR